MTKKSKNAKMTKIPQTLQNLPVPDFRPHRGSNVADIPPRSHTSAQGPACHQCSNLPRTSRKSLSTKKNLLKLKDFKNTSNAHLCNSPPTLSTQPCQPPQALETSIRPATVFNGAFNHVTPVTAQFVTTAAGVEKTQLARELDGKIHNLWICFEDILDGFVVGQLKGLDNFA